MARKKKETQETTLVEKVETAEVVDTTYVEEPKELSPSEYFNMVKDKKNTMSDEYLQSLYNNSLSMFKKYMITGQKYAAKNTYDTLEMIQKERELMLRGINTYVLLDDIIEYIEKVADKAVKIIELKQFERDIPDELVDKIVETREIFSEFYIVFTDYTKEDTKKVEKRRREKDPILFGNIEVDGKVTDRFYYIGDWEDEYCHLTLNEMINEMSKKNKDIKYDLSLPIDLAGIKDYVKNGKTLTREEFTKLIEVKKNA